MPDWSRALRTLFLTMMTIVPGVLALTGEAAAHPHVWATVRSEVVFGPDRKITGIKHAWTFDEFYSAMAVQGLDADEDSVYSKKELDPLAKVNVDSLDDFGYFTFVRAAGEEKFLPLKPPEDYWVEYGDGVLTLKFTLPLETPLDPGTEGVTLDVYDPSFFVAFGFAEKDPVTIAGAPKGCTAKMDIPDPEAAEAAKALTESFFSELGPGSDYGSQFAQNVTVLCEAP